MKDWSMDVLLLVHQREHVLPLIFDQLCTLLGQLHVQITANQPSAAVVQVLTRGCMKLHKHGHTVQLLEAPFNPLGEKERFIELRHWQLEQLPARSDYGVLWDDDHILEDPEELSTVLRSGIDLTYATKVFFWDSPTLVATHIPAHRSVFAFRQLPGDRFPLDRGIHAPERIHDTAKRVVDLRGRLLDYGYLRPEDRRRCWDDYRRVGKIDPVTIPLVQPPTLEDWTGVNPYAT